MMRLRFLQILLVLALPAIAAAEERFPPPEFRSGYQMPQTQTSPARATQWMIIDTAALTVALSLAAYLVLKKRSRTGVFALTLASVLYFGFYRKGCVCAIGSIQNVSLAAFNGGYALPWVVAAFFLLPLIFTLFFGRVFCSSVCPLGAIQDLVLWKPIQIPRWLDESIGLFAYAYLALAVLLAATGSNFIICQYDPFVGFFRLSAPAHMLVLGGILLLISMFVGRIYCRMFCPYGVLLRWLSPLAKWRVSITPKECIDCRLCEQSCPFGAIRQPTRDTGAKSRPNSRDRSRLALLLLVLPILMIAGGVVGYFGGRPLSRVDATVDLAARVWQDEHAPAPQPGDEIDAFRNTGQTAESLYAKAAIIQHKFTIGTSLMGAFLGLIVGLKLIAHSVRRRSSDYTADPGTCLGCARCYRLCPVEQKRLGLTPTVPV